MVRPTRAIAAVAAGFALATVLTGCMPWAFFDRDGGGGGMRDDRGGVQRRDEASPVPETPLQFDDESSTCAPGDDLVIQGSARSVEVDGDCGRVVVRGSALSVQLSSAESLLLEGQATSISVDGELGGLEIRGTANAIETGSLGALAISGDDNTVQTGRIGAVSINGDGNRVEASNDPQPLSVTGDGNTVSRSG